MSDFVPSKYQADFFEWVDAGTGSALVEAVAGSGKSTTIRKAAKRIPSSQTVKVLSFNAHITREMLEKLKADGVGPNVEASTFHSLGYSAVRRRLKSQGIVCRDPDGKKMRTVIREMLEEDERRLRSESIRDRRLVAEDETNMSETGSYQDLYGDFVYKLVGLAKGQGFGAIQPAGYDDWYGLIVHHDLSLDSDAASEDVAIELARRALRESNAKAAEGWIDFDDMLYLPLLWKLKLWQFDWVMIDEAQDTNPVRRAVAKLALKPGGRLVAVGDRRQAIYGFTGASHDAMDLIKREFSCREFPLSVCYRCGSAIVEHARSIVPHLEAADGAPEGEVSFVTLREALKRLQPTDAIMCRNTAPLIELAFKLVGQGVGCKVLGREIGAGLVSLVKKQNAKGLANLLDRLNAYR